MNEDKIVKSIIHEIDYALTLKSYDKCLVDICHTLDIPTPLSLVYHYKCYDNFNMVKYKGDDFVESVQFTSLVLENCLDK